jgi:hypothetical protein
MRSLEPAVLPLSIPTSEKSPILDDSVERSIGLGVAELASIIARGLLERENGELKKETRNEGADMLARLARVKMHHPGFDEVARKWGKQALIEHISSPPDPQVPDEVMVEKLINVTLALLSGLIKQACN